MASRHYALLILILAFIDSFIFAAPVTTFFIIIIARKGTDVNKCLISVMGGILAGSIAGYALGYFVLIRGEEWLTGAAQLIMDKNAGFSVDLYYRIRSMYQSWGFLAMIAGAYTPVPYGMFSISSGLVKMNILLFLSLTFISHFIKYLLLAYLTVWMQNKIKKLGSLRRRQILQYVSATILTAITWLRFR